MKKIFLSSLFAFSIVSGISAADKWPPEKLAEQAKANIQLGVITLKAWKNKEKFPAAEMIDDVSPSDRNRDDGVEFVKGKAEIVIGKENVYMGTQGRIEEAGESYDWAPLLLVNIKNPGTFSISGKITGKQKEDDENVKAVSWAIVIIDKKGKMEALASGKIGNGEVINIEETLKQIKLKTDESIGISFWRHQYNWWGGAYLSDFSIKRIK